MEQGENIRWGASPAQAAGPRAVLRMPLQLRSSAPERSCSSPQAPPPCPTVGKLTPYAGCYTCAENKQGASVRRVRVGGCLRPQRKPAASSRLSLRWAGNRTIPHLHPTSSLLLTRSSPLPRAPLDPQVTLPPGILPQRGGRPPFPSLPAGVVPALCVEACVLGSM